ncbi:LamG domain-containing protein [bacterium]|nr:LamG domain-containing protein [bacterium]
MNRFWFITIIAVFSFCQVAMAANMALKLEGDPESFFDVPDNDSLDGDIGDQLTVEAWVNPDKADGENMILNKEDSYEIAVVDGTFQVAIQPAGGGWEWVVENAGPVNASEWTHVAATYDGTVIRTYVSGKHYSTFDKSGVLNNSSDTFKVGRRERGGDTHSIYTGLIDEVRISKVVRYTEAGFDVPTTAFESDDDTVALYHFDDTVKDSSNYGNHGSLVNDAVLVPADTPIAAVDAAGKLAITWGKMKSE